MFDQAYLFSYGFNGLICLIGISYLLFPAKNINKYWGYKTESAKKDQHSWNFAQILAGKVYLIFSVTGFLITYTSTLFLESKYVLLISLIPAFLFNFLTMYFVEKKLKS